MMLVNGSGFGADGMAQKMELITLFVFDDGMVNYY
jgi:hypothetical protein